MSTPEPAPGPLHCSLCKEPLAEPRFYVEVIGRNIYHRHCARTLVRRRTDSVAVPLAVARSLLRAPLPWRLLECGFRFDARDAWWGCYWDRSDVRLTLYLCFVPFVPLRIVLGPRLRHALPATGRAASSAH